MYSWNAVSAVLLQRPGEISAAFAQFGVDDYRAAARYVAILPYGRNRTVTDALIVLREGRGTCSTKHALLRRLAAEQDLGVALILGIYEMSAQNTLGVEGVLRKYGLSTLPEAHCYLRIGSKRIDLTRVSHEGQRLQPLRFLHEEEIDPEQVGSYKFDLHRRFLKQWVTETGANGCRSLQELWRIREECIVALSRKAQ